MGPTASMVGTGWGTGGTRIYLPAVKVAEVFPVLATQIGSVDSLTKWTMSPEQEVLLIAWPLSQPPHCVWNLRFTSSLLQMSFAKMWQHIPDIASLNKMTHLVSTPSNAG